MRPVTVFVDWETTTRLCPKDKRRRWTAETRAEETIRRLCGRLVDLLTDLDSQGAFRVQMRLYHGWHRGKTPTEDCRAVERFVFSKTTIGRVSFASELSFGSNLLCGGPRGRLYDTLRAADRTRAPRNPAELEQKMVDTALASDLVWFARSSAGDSGRLAVVVGDDDDHWPGVFTAFQMGCPVRVLRIDRDDENRHLETDGLVWKGGGK